MHAKHEIDPFAKLITSAVITADDNRLVAYGQVKLIPEAVLLFADKASTKEKVLALRCLLKAGKHLTYRDQFDKLYIFTEDHKFAHYLMKNEEFSEMVGTVLKADLS